MPDKKLTDNEIIKEFETLIQCAKFVDSEYITSPVEVKYLVSALDLINRLEAENEKFKKRQKPTAASGYKIENGKVVFFVDMLGGYSYEYKDLDEVVKTLNELLKECYSKDEIAFALKCKTEELKTAKAEAYKEFAERLNKEFDEMRREYRNVLNSDGACAMIIAIKTTNNLLKELVGDSNAR